MEDLRALAQAPRELWIVLFAKFLESVGLFSLLYTVVLWLSKDYGFSDVRAGWWVSAFSLLLTAFAFISGFIADSVGHRSMLIAAFGASAVARGTMAFAPGPKTALFGLMFLTLGASAGVPVMNSAIRRYTNSKNRSFAFSIYYLSFNIGGAAAGFLVDWARDRFKDPSGESQIAKVIELPLLGAKTMTWCGMVYFVGLLCAVAAFFVSLGLRKNIDVDADEQLALQRAAHDASEETEESYRKAKTAFVAPTIERKAPWHIAIEVMSERSFWRFMLFIGLLVMVKMIFTHYHFTFPKYALREMGESFPLGKVDAINPILIIFLVPIATALTRHRSAFNCIILGSLISTASVFVLCLGANWFTIVGFTVLLSIGEALWSPRLYEYTAVIAPRGREASYMGLSALPTFFAKFAVGPLSGYLLASYCPEKGPRNSPVMWGVIGLITVVGPILIIVLRGVIEGRNAKSGVAPKKALEPKAA